MIITEYGNNIYDIIYDIVQKKNVIKYEIYDIMYKNSSYMISSMIQCMILCMISQNIKSCMISHAIS